MDNIRLIKQENYQSMPWKNGLGVTRQIDIQPPGSPFPSDTFSWRVSSATVSGSNEFSQFPGCERILVVLKGDGLLLNKNITLHPCKPYAFSGEEAINCEVIGDEAVIDYGIIFRRDDFNATMNILEFGMDQMNTSVSGDLHFGQGWHYLTSIHGSFSVDDTVVNIGDTAMFTVEKDDSNFQSVTIVSKENIQLIHVHVWSHK